MLFPLESSYCHVPLTSHKSKTSHSYNFIHTMINKINKYYHQQVGKDRQAKEGVSSRIKLHIAHRHNQWTGKTNYQHYYGKRLKLSIGFMWYYPNKNNIIMMNQICPNYTLFMLKIKNCPDYIQAKLQPCPTPKGSGGEKQGW